jgi:two-component system response regulator FixJ
MPGVNGIALTAQLRGRGLTLPVIVISGHGDIPMAVQAVRAGAFDFIEKPFEDEVLIDSLTRAFSAKTDPEDGVRLGRIIEALPVEDRALLDCLLAGWDNQRMAAHFDTESREVEQRMGRIIAGMAAGNLSTLLRSLLALRRART